MALITPPFAFAHCTDSMDGTPANNTHGVSFTCAGSGEGTTVALISSALTHDVHYIVLAMGGCAFSGLDADGVADLMIDPAGGTSWSEYVSNLVIGFTPFASALIQLVYFHFPIWIPAGANLGIRGKSNSGTNTSCLAAIWAFGEPNRPDMWWCGRGVEALGITEGSAHGARVTPGNSGSFGSWTSIGSPTSARYGALHLAIGPSDSSATAIGYHWEVGYGSNRVPGSPTIYSANTTSESGLRVYPGPIFCDIPAGTQMQARGKASGTAEAHDVAIYGVY